MVSIGVGFLCSEDIEGERIFEIANDHSQRSALTASQRARMEIGMVAELLYRFQNANARPLFDIDTIVQHPRYSAH